MKAHSHSITCEKCETVVEVMLHKSEAGRFDPSGRSHTDCDPQDAYCDPSECTECGHPLMIDEDIDAIMLDEWIAHAEDKADADREDRQMEERYG